MGRKALIKLTHAVTSLATGGLCVLTICSTLAGHFDPNNHQTWAIMSFLMPLFILCNVGILLYWAFARRWVLCIFPLVAIAWSFPTIQRFGKFIWFGNETKANLVVVSYNVGRFNNQASLVPIRSILDEFAKEKVDIICMQEFSSPQDEKGESNASLIKQQYPHIASCNKGGHDMLIVASKYPIVNYQCFWFQNTANDYMWADVNVNGRVVRIYNMHLQTTTYNAMMRNIAKRSAMGDNESKINLLEVFGNQYMESYQKRATQVNFFKRQHDKSNVQGPILICGDFNDLPNSYTYQILSKDMTDGFTDCGAGYGYTYRYLGKLMRIDYVLYSKEFKGVKYTSPEWEYSDHNPVIMELTF